MWLPLDIEKLIRSFLPKPPVPYVQIPQRPLYFRYDYMSIADWKDTDEAMAYGDF